MTLRRTRLIWKSLGRTVARCVPIGRATTSSSSRRARLVWRSPMHRRRAWCMGALGVGRIWGPPANGRIALTLNGAAPVAISGCSRPNSSRSAGGPGVTWSPRTRFRAFLPRPRGRPRANGSSQLSCTKLTGAFLPGGLSSCLSVIDQLWRPIPDRSRPPIRQVTELSITCGGIHPLRLGCRRGAPGSGLCTFGLPHAGMLWAPARPFGSGCAHAQQPDNLLRGPPEAER